MSGISRSWNSTATSLTYLLTSGMEGKTFALESTVYRLGRLHADSVLRCHRDPCAHAEGSGSHGGGDQAAPGVCPNTREYSLKTVSSTVDIDAAPFGDYTVTGTGAVQLTGDTQDHMIPGSSAQGGAEHLYPPHSEGSFRTGDAGCAFPEQRCR